METPAPSWRSAPGLHELMERCLKIPSTRETATEVGSTDERIPRPLVQLGGAREESAAMRGRRVLYRRGALCARLHAVRSGGGITPPPLRRLAVRHSRSHGIAGVLGTSDNTLGYRYAAACWAAACRRRLGKVIAWERRRTPLRRASPGSRGVGNRGRYTQQSLHALRETWQLASRDRGVRVASPH